MIYMRMGEKGVNQKNKKADYVINTDQDLEQVERQVINFIKTMRKFND